MLADALPDPSSANSIGWLLVCAAAAIAAGNQIDAFIKRRSGQPDSTVGPQPFVVKPEAEYVNRRDFEVHIAEVRRDRDQLHAKLGGMERGLREEMKADIEKLHEKVNTTNLGVARLETETRSQNTLLAQLREDLHAAFHRVTKE